MRGKHKQAPAVLTLACPHVDATGQCVYQCGLIVGLDTSKGKTPVVFYSHEIILLLSNVLKEPKFQISECRKVSQSLYKKMKVYERII